MADSPTTPNPVVVTPTSTPSGTANMNPKAPAQRVAFNGIGQLPTRPTPITPIRRK